MTGYRSRFFRHSCATSGCYVDSLPCWDDMIQCFPRKIRPTDVDGFVEINGEFLFLEEKSAGVAPDNGQRIALRRLAGLPGVTVVFFRPNEPVSDLETLVFDGSEPCGWQPCSTTQFHAWLRRWALAADSKEAA